MAKKNNRTCAVSVLAVMVAAIAIFSGPAVLYAPPKPALVPLPGTWQLDVQLYGNPQRITVTLPGADKPKSYWYLLYTITNKTGQEVEFYPQFELFTDTFKLYKAGVGVRRPVFEAIAEQYANTMPLLEPESLVTGRVLLGQDNARDSVAVFEDFEPKATNVKVFVSGLSNETVTVKSPVRVDAESGEPKELLLRKTLMLEYRVPGDELNLENRIMLYNKRDWVMR